MQKIKIGFLGCGNIGGGVFSLLEDMKYDIEKKHRISFEIKKMLVRALDEKRAVDVPLQLLTTDVNEILDDPEISLVCEFMGGEQPAAQFMHRALCAGKHVVTANKMALSLNWQKLHQAAAEHHVGLYYEASVCGAIPVIRTINESMTGSRITGVFGIVNGTTNYILTQMAENGLSYPDALSQAQALGLAEPDPTSDVEGHDAAYKLSILSALCYGKYVNPKTIFCKGITSVDITDILIGKQLGLTMKLIAASKHDDGVIRCSVSPTFLPATNQLTHVNGAFNGVLLHGHASDDIFLCGRGAGALPTASAIVGDMIQAAMLTEMACGSFENADADGPHNTVYYMRISSQNAADAMICAGNIVGKDAVHLHTLTVDEKAYAVLLTDKISSADAGNIRAAIQAKTGEEIVCWPVEGMV